MKRIVFLVLICISTLSNVYASSDAANQIIFKIKPFYSPSSGKFSDFTPSNNQDPVKIFSLSYGLDSSVSYFISDHFSAEFSGGIGYLRTSKDKLTTLAVRYTNGAAPDDYNMNTLYFPISAGIQFHMAPYGAIRPYVGLGYNYTILHSPKPFVNYKNSHSFMFQAGVNFVFKDDTMFVFEIKHSKVKSNAKVKYNEAAVTKEGKSVLKFDNLMIQAGIGWSL